MRTTAIGRLTLGPGRTPAICVPLTAPEPEGLATAACTISPDVADLVELRLDHVASASSDAATPSIDAAVAAIGSVRQSLHAGIPLLLTYRSAAEGGLGAAAPDAIASMLVAGMRSGSVDAVDVEQSLPPEVRDPLVAAAHAAGVPVVMSAHNFQATPPAAAIEQQLRTQQTLGADVVKVAFMPGSAADVLAVLAATHSFTEDPAAVPAITMAMGALGAITRLAGETFGSAVTFGRVGAGSAPGQMDAAALRIALDALHEASAT